MPAGTSLGSAIALQRGGRNDYWMRKLADDWATRRAAKEKAKQEKQKQAGDNKKWFLGMMSVPAGEWANMYLKDAQSVLENAYNLAEPFYETGDIVALHKIASDAKAKIEKIKSNNDRGVEYYKNPNIIKNNEATRTFFSDESTYEDMLPFNNVLAKNPIHLANGEVSADVTIPNKFEIEMLKPDDFVYENNAKPLYQLKGSNTNVYKIKRFVSDAAKEQKAKQLMGDLNYMQYALSTLINSKPSSEISKLDLDRAKGETADQFLARNPDFAKELDLFTRTFIDNNSSQPIYDETKASPPPPREKSQPTTVLVVQNKQTIPGKNWSEQYQQSVPGVGAGIPQYVTPEFEFDARINVSNSGTSYIPVTAEMIEMNPELAGLRTIQFQPGELLRGILPDGSGYGWYSTGKVTSYQADSGPYAEYMTEEEKQYKMETLTPLIPVQDVIPSVIGKYPDVINIINSSQNAGGNKNSRGGGLTGGTSR